DVQLPGPWGRDGVTPPGRWRQAPGTWRECPERPGCQALRPARMGRCLASSPDADLHGAPLVTPSPASSTSPPRVLVLGHRGMVGSALVRRLEARGGCTVVTVDRKELDLTRQREVEDFFAGARVDQVYLAAAKVGG